MLCGYFSSLHYANHVSCMHMSNKWNMVPRIYQYPLLNHSIVYILFPEMVWKSPDEIYLLDSRTQQNRSSEFFQTLDAIISPCCLLFRFWTRLWLLLCWKWSLDTENLRTVSAIKTRSLLNRRCICTSYFRGRVSSLWFAMRVPPSTRLSRARW